jgi:hypothetical protein
MNIDPVHLAFRSTAEGAQKILHELEAELAVAKERRDMLLNDINKASAAAVRDQRARVELAGLNKQDGEVGRLIRSIERQVVEAKKRVAMAANQAAAASAKQAELDAAALPRDKWFAVSCPDGRVVRHRHSSMDALQRELQPGYRATGQVFGANEDGSGGFVSMPGAPLMLKALLESQGDVLMEWLEARGIVGAGKTTVVLPPNGRDLQ